MAIWSIRDYLDAQGTNVIRVWLDSLPKKAAAKIDARILVLRAFPVWQEPYVKPLKGFDGILELRVVFGGVQYRPLGTYGPWNREFTLLVGAIEKGKLSKDVCEVAVVRRNAVLTNRSRTIEHQF